MAYNFDTIARTYDRLNHIMTLGLDRRWRRIGTQAACLRQQSEDCDSHLSVLDVACGTGDMTIELMKQGCQVTGIDLSEEMLEIAKQKAASSNSQFSIFNFQLGNAEVLTFPDATFDAITCAFGIRNFENLEAGLKEMAIVLKPDGTMVILELSTPDSLLITPFYRFYANRIIPLLGKRIAGNREAYTYLPDSIAKFPKGKAMLQILSNCGLQASQRKLLFGICRIYVCTK